MLKKIFRIILILILLFIAIYFIFLRQRYPVHAVLNSVTVGDSVDSFNGVIVYNNGMVYSKSHGKHYSEPDSFYYGKKWQCVEYIKRYYHDHLHHKMPNGFGHAKDFFDPDVPQGKLNKSRNLIQYRNGDEEPPAVNDIVVFEGKFGHVAIVTEVTEDEVEVIQQNIYMQPRERFPLLRTGNKFTMGNGRKPVGWLRKDDAADH